jgi:hypothetical protein
MNVRPVLLPPRPSVARKLWEAAAEGSLATQWVRALALSVILVPAWWEARIFLFPFLPWQLTAPVSEVLFVSVFWFAGPLRYYVRWLRADARIARRKRRS